MVILALVRPVVAQGHKRASVNATGYKVRFPLEEMKYLIF